MSINVPKISPDDLISFHLRKFGRLPAYMKDQICDPQPSENAQSPFVENDAQSSHDNTQHQLAQENTQLQPRSDNQQFHDDGTRCVLSPQEISYFRAQWLHKLQFREEQKNRRRKLKRKKREDEGTVKRVKSE